MPDYCDIRTGTTLSVLNLRLTITPDLLRSDFAFGGVKQIKPTKPGTRHYTLYLLIAIITCENGIYIYCVCVCVRVIYRA